MRVLRLIALVWLAAAAAGAVDAQRLALARSKVAKAEKRLAKSKVAEAEALFRAAIADEPALPDAHLGLAGLLCGQRRWAEALPVVERAKEAYVSWAQAASATEMEARQEAATRAREFADLQNAQKLRASPGQPQPTLTLTAMAASRVATEEYLSRHGWGMEQLAAIPAQAFYLAGLCELHVGSRGAAITELRACVTRDPGHGLGHYNLAVALFGEGDATAAAEHLDAARAAGVEPNPQFVADLQRVLAASPPVK